MNHMKTVSSSSHNQGFHLSLQPAPAWTVILGFVLFTVLCTLAGAGSILRLAYPAGAFAVGVFLYWRYPVLYIGFTWWILFLTPLVRRMVDYRSGWDPQGLMLVSPLLVTLVTLVTLLRHIPNAYRQGGLPFILAFIGVVYGFLIGLIQGSPAVTVRSLVDWLPPIIFGFHLLMNWRNYPSYRQNIERTFLWGVLIMGAYALVQYMVAPDWDRFWLKQAQEMGGTSFGHPEPFKMRIWSTLNSPGPFATVMMAGLLLLFNSQETLRFPAAGFGYFSLLLSLVRSAWGGWFVGLVTLLGTQKLRRQMSLIITILVVAACVFPLTTMEPFSEVINSRVQTLSNVEEDGSYQARQFVYKQLIEKALTEFLGEGLGSSNLADSGILPILLELGWLGAIPYLGGVILLLFNLFQSSKAPLDSFISATRAICLSYLMMLLMGNTLTSSPGMIFWGFLGLAIGGHKYYQYQQTVALKRD